MNPFLYEVTVTLAIQKTIKVHAYSEQDASDQVFLKMLTKNLQPEDIKKVHVRKVK
jgi:lysozyme family protein